MTEECGFFIHSLEGGNKIKGRSVKPMRLNVTPDYFSEVYVRLAVTRTPLIRNHAPDAAN